jgi:hypothetical protein
VDAVRDPSQFAEFSVESKPPWTLPAQETGRGFRPRTSEAGEPLPARSGTQEREEPAGKAGVLCPECGLLSKTASESLMHFIREHQLGQDAWTVYAGGWAGSGPNRRAICLICNQQARNPVDILKHAVQEHFKELLAFIEQTALKRGSIPEQHQAWTAKCQLEHSRSAQQNHLV